ncbi:MAG: nuclear transport factor 2 family protein [Roseiflexaceae bacterium]
METVTHDSRQTVAAFWATMQTNNFRAVGDLLADSYVLEWPQSSERIRGRAHFIAVNEHYPAAGHWQFTIHRLIADGNEVASEVTVTDGVITGRVLTFSIVRDGKIVQQVEYWPDPFEAAPCRAEWVEYMEDYS